MTELCSVIRCGVICEADYSGSRIEHADVCGTGMKGGDMKYIIKKLTTTAATVLIVSFLVFLAFSVIPGGSGAVQAGDAGDAGSALGAAGGDGIKPAAYRALRGLAYFVCEGRYGGVLQLSYAGAVHDP